MGCVYFKIRGNDMTERIWEPDPSAHLETLKDWVSQEVAEALDIAIEKEGKIYLSSTGESVSITFSSGIWKPDKAGELNDIYHLDVDLYKVAKSFLSDYSGRRGLSAGQVEDYKMRVEVLEKIAIEARAELDRAIQNSTTYKNLS
jgi:hypothetical protein